MILFQLTFCNYYWHKDLPSKLHFPHEIFTNGIFWNHSSLRIKISLPKLHHVKNPGIGVTRLVLKQIVLGSQKENRKKKVLYV